MQPKTFGAWTGSVSGIGAGALTASPDYQYLAPYVAMASAAVWGGMLLWFLIANRREIRSGVAKLGSWYFILPCFALAILAIAGAAYGMGLRASPAKEIVTVSTVETVTGEPTKSPATLLGRYAGRGKGDFEDNLTALSRLLNIRGGDASKRSDVIISIWQQQFHAPTWDHYEPIDKHAQEIWSTLDEIRDSIWEKMRPNYPDQMADLDDIIGSLDRLDNFRRAVQQLRITLGSFSLLMKSEDAQIRSNAPLVFKSGYMDFVTAANNFKAWISQCNVKIEAKRKALG